MSYETIFFDFDGVLSTDRFYTTLQNQYSHVYEFIQTNIFGGNSTISQQRMRHEITMNDVNTYISEQTEIGYEVLMALFEESVRNIQVDTGLLDIATQLQKNGKKVALVTNNMDVFNTIVIPHRNLHTIFPHIINSCDHGILKHEQNGKLFDIAMAKVGSSDYKRTLLIDDSATSRATFEKKGGNTFAYTTFATFHDRAQTNLEIFHTHENK